MKGVNEGERGKYENLGYDLIQGEAQPLVKGDRTVSILIHRLFHHHGDVGDDSGGFGDNGGNVGDNGGAAIITRWVI